MRSHTKIFAAATLVTAVIALGACPGEIDDPERFTTGTSPGCGDVPADLLMPSCSEGPCHDSESLAGGLDLASPGVAERLVGVPGSDGCDNIVLADPNNPEDSLLVRKLGPDPPCGARMPQLADPLTAEQIACIEEWIASLEGAGGGGGMDTTSVGGMGGSAGGSAGGAGGAGGA